MHWPVNGTRIVGDTFTWRGRLDDPSATVSVQLTAPDNTVSTDVGIVERNGLFWVENLPLATGTSQLILTATDAASNSSTTTISVVKSGVVLALGDLSNTDLNADTIAATGTIGSPDYAVWVNGVRATVDGAGNWSTAAAPLNSGSTAVIQVRAIPLADNNGNGTGGGGKPEYGNTANPASAQAIDLEQDPETKPRLPFIKTYWRRRVESLAVANYGNWEGPVEVGSRLDWKDKLGGDESIGELYGPRWNNDVCVAPNTWPATWWPALPFGAWAKECDVQGNSSGQADQPPVRFECKDYIIAPKVPPGALAGSEQSIFIT